MGERDALTYKYPISCKESAIFWALLETALQMGAPRPSYRRHSQTTQMCSEVEALSAGSDLLEKVNTLFNFH